MAENVKKPSTKSKLLNFAKVLGIVLGGVFGLIAISLGIIALTGGFNPPHVELEGLKFEQNVYVIDGNLEKVSKQDGTEYHIDYQIKVDEDENPIYQTIKALPTNEDCTELDAKLTIINGRNLQIVEDKYTKAIGKTEEDDENTEYQEYTVKLTKNIKVLPKTEKHIFEDENGQTFERDVNIGGWTLLQIEQGMHISYCYIFVDVPVYEYKIAAIEKDGVEKYQPTGEEAEGEYIPDYLVDNTASNGAQFTFALNGSEIFEESNQLHSFDTLYYVNAPKLDFDEERNRKKLGFTLSEEIQKNYPERYKQIIFKSSDESVAQITQNSNNTATVTLQPNSYGKTFEITSYVVSIYNDFDRLPQLDEYKRKYPAGEAEEKYNEDFEKMVKYSINTLSFKVNKLEIETFEVSQQELSYYVFDTSVINLTRDGSSRANSKTSNNSYFNMSIALNQHFADEHSKLDEILNNVEVSVVNYEGGEYKPYDNESYDSALQIVVDNLGTKTLVINKEPAYRSYIQFAYGQDENGEGGFIARCPIKVLVHETTLSISKSSLSVNYFAKPVDGTVGDSVNNNTDIALELNPMLASQNATYSKVMYFINHSKIDGSASSVVAVSDKKIKVNSEDYFALSYKPENEGDEEEIDLNNILRVQGSFSNAKLLVAIVKTCFDEEGKLQILTDGDYIQYYCLATNVSGTTRYVSVTSEQQFEIDKCVLVLGKQEDNQVDLNGDLSNYIDLYGTIENPYKVLSKNDIEGGNSFATFIMTYYGPLLENSNFFIDYSKLYGKVTYSTNTDFTITPDDIGLFVLTFNANEEGEGKVSFNAYSNPSWSKTITFNVTNDIISELHLNYTNSINPAVGNVITAPYNLSANSVDYANIEFSVSFSPINSNSSTTSVRSFTLSNDTKYMLCELLGIVDVSNTTLSDIVGLLNNNNKVRKQICDILTNDSYTVDVNSYNDKDTTLSAEIKAAGDALVVVYAFTNGEVTLASEAYIISVPKLVLSSTTFVQDQTYLSLGNNKLAKSNSEGGINYNVIGIGDSSTANSVLISNNSFTFDGNAVSSEAIKFAFLNEQSAYGSVLSEEGSGVRLIFGAVSDKRTISVYAYMGESIESNFCVYEMRFVVESDFVTQADSISSKQVAANEYVDLFEAINGKPSIIITNTEGNKLFLPLGYDVSNILSEYNETFLQQFWYTDADEGQEYYHIYCSLVIEGNGVTFNANTGKAKFASSNNKVKIVSNGGEGAVVATISIQVGNDPTPQSVEPNFTQVEFDGTDYVLNNNIAFLPQDAQVEITQIDFDVVGMNSYEGFPEGTEFSQSDNVLVGTVDLGFGPISLNILKIVENDGTYTLSKDEGYDTAMSLLSAQDIHQIQFDLIVSYSYLGQTYQRALTVMINF